MRRGVAAFKPREAHLRLFSRTTGGTKRRHQDTVKRLPKPLLSTSAAGFKWESKRVLFKFGVSRQSELAALLPKLMLC